MLILSTVNLEVRYVDVKILSVPAKRSVSSRTCNNNSCISGACRKRADD